MLWNAGSLKLVKAQTETESYWTGYQLSDLETCLPATYFFRAQCAALVNLRKVKEIAPPRSTYLLILADHEATEIQVSERQAKKLRQVLW